MKIFLDEGYTQEVALDQPFDFGIVDAGTSKKYTYYLLNESKCRLIDLKFKFAHPDVFILHSPSEMLPESKGILEVEWRPDQLEESIEVTILIEGRKITTRRPS